MALQIRRGTAAQRTSITPAAGELLYTTDTKLVYVGDGTTAGGNIISGGGGITDIVNDTTPQLGGNLDVNGHNIVSASNGNITISPNGTGRIFVTSSITRTSGNINIAPLSGLTVIGDAPNNVDGNLYIVRDTYSTALGTGFTFAQHHNTAEAVNFSFFRSRGTADAQTKVLNNDRLGNIVFGASDGTQALGGAVIQATAVADSSVNFLRANLRFLTSNGAFPLPHLELTYDGILKVKTLQAYSGTNINIATNNTLTIGATRLDNNGLRTYASNANLIIAANGSGRIYLDGSGWPSSLGTSGQFLTTDGAGLLSWSNPPGSAVRTSAAGSTTSLLNNGTGPINITGYKTYSLLKIQSSHAAWIRLYVSDAARTADASRAEGVDPAPGAGVLAEIVTTGSETILMSPGVFGWNNESPVTTNIPCAVTNKSGSTAIITVTLTLVQLEV